MAYATVADMNEQLGENEVLALGDRDGDGLLDAGVIENALDKASAEIDTYIGQRYTLPLASPVSILATYCCDIARYRLVGAAATETEAVRVRYKDAVRFLEAVRDGKIKLGDAGANLAQPGANLVKVSTGNNIFSRPR